MENLRRSANPSPKKNMVTKIFIFCNIKILFLNSHKTDFSITGSLYEGLILKAIMKRNFNLFFMGRKIIMAALVVFVTNESMF